MLKQEILKSNKETGKRVWGYYPLAFAVPMILTLLAMIALQIAPFGDKSLTINDANGYYVPYISYLKSILHRNHGLFYSFSQDIGGGIAGTIWPYLLNPFSWILAAFEYESYPAAYSYGVMLITGLYGLSMYLLLADIRGHKTENLLISTVYAMSGFAVCFNIYTAFFFGGPLCLPLMVLGLRKILRGESPALYAIAIAYPIVLQIQMGFAICMAAVLFFLAKVYVEDRRQDIKQLFLRFAAASVCGGLLGCVIWLPGILVIRQGRGSMAINDFLFLSNAPLLQYGARFFTGAHSTNQISSGYPAIFCGILPLALVILYFMNKNVSRKRKKTYLVLLTVYILGFCIRTFTSVFQGFTHANWFNYRFSFVFIFLLLLIASEELDQLDEITEQDVKRCGLILLGFSILVFFTTYEFVDSAMVVLDLTLLAGMGAAFLFHKKAPDRAPKNVLILTFCLCTFFQLYLNYYFCSKAVFKGWPELGLHYADYIGKKEPLIRGVQNYDDGFYRIESEQELANSIGNDGFFLDYNGVGFAGHTERKFVSIGLSRLGIDLFSECWNSYDAGTPAATDALLGIKYMLSERDLEEEKDYIRKVDIDGLALYESPYALPIAMVSEEGLSTVSIAEGGNIFENLNAIWCGLTGDKREIFTEETDIAFSNHNPTDVYTMTHADVMELVKDASSESEDNIRSSGSSSEGSEISQQDKEKDSQRYKPYIEFSFTAKQSGPVYLYDSASYIEGFGTLEDIVQYVGTYKKGEEVIGKLYLNYTVTEQILVDTVKALHICYADNALLQEYCGLIRDRDCTVTKESDSKLSGDVQLGEGELLFFTIPYDKGWTLIVDGVEHPLELSADLFMSADLTPGVHHYEMRFVPEGFAFGAVLSAVALLTLLFQCAVKIRKNPRSKENEETI